MDGRRLGWPVLDVAHDRVSTAQIATNGLANGELSECDVRCRCSYEMTGAERIRRLRFLVDSRRLVG